VEGRGTNSYELHITVGTTPQRDSDAGTGSSFSLAHDLRLVKAALLYASSVTLCSPASSLVLSALALRDLRQADRVAFMERVIPILTPDTAESTLPWLKVYRDLENKKYRSRDELILKWRFDALFTNQWSEVSRVVGQLAQDMHADGLEKAVASGILELRSCLSGDPLDGVVYAIRAALHNDDPSRFPKLEVQSPTDEMAQTFLDQIGQAVMDRRTYPLFDEAAARLIRLAIEAGLMQVTTPAIARGRHSGLAANLLQRLPLFDEASVDEILAIRSELDRYLVRFRGSVLKYSSQIESEAWSDDFESEADEVFIRDVAPAILDIEDAVKSNSYLSNLATRAVGISVTGVPATSLAVMVTHSHLTQLPAVVLGSIGAGLLSAATLYTYTAFHEWSEQHHKIESSSLYFYYRTAQQLSD
jgi:hypothetical protein